MSNHNERIPYVPAYLDRVTHGRLRRAKPGVLGHAYDGPFPIVERIGTTCIKLRVGSYANGTPRYEIHHWDNAKPAMVLDETVAVEKPRRGRKKARIEEDTVDELNGSANHPASPSITTRAGRIPKPPDRFMP